MAKGGKARFGKGASLAPSKQTSSKQGWGPAPAAHVQRKLAKKMQFMDKLAAANSSSRAGGSSGLGVQGAATKKRSAQKQKKKRRPIAALEDLGSLQATLEEAAAAQAQASSLGAERKKNAASAQHSRGRALIAAQESARLMQVLSHPAYKADPLAAIAKHIAASVAPLAATDGKKQEQQCSGKAQGPAAAAASVKVSKPGSSRSGPVRMQR